MVMGEVEAVVVQAKGFDLHGVRYHDVTVAYPDRSVENARLGPEGAPADLAAGDPVLVTRVANMIVSVRRP
jgi:hypothetical protein